MEVIIASIIVLSFIGLALGFIIAYTAKVFAVHADSRVEKLTGMLPGVNCGGCGFAGCADFANALVKGEASDLSACTACTEDDRKKISAFLGLESYEHEKKVAVVLCGGDRKTAKFAALYNGINDCSSAALVAGGAKSCQYGCLGLGSCSRACPFGAIEITKAELAVVHPELCTGCGICVKVCPKKLIKLAPVRAHVHVFCSSPQKGPAKRKFCEVACIACRKCVRTAGESRISMNGYLARVVYDNPPEIEIIEKAGCPTGCLKSSLPLSDKSKSQKREAA